MVTAVAASHGQQQGSGGGKGTKGDGDSHASYNTNDMADEQNPTAKQPEPKFEFRFDGSSSAAAARRSAPVAKLEEEEPSTHTVTVLIPARDEEHNLPGCLRSLMAQSEPGFLLGEQWHIFVIDDNSADGTLALAYRLAESQPGLHVLQAKALKVERRGFTGKNAALWFGASQDLAHTAKWLLFTDADTMHEPGSLSRAIVEADRHQVAMLSYSPRQIAANVIQRAVMPLVFSELASSYPPRKINDPSSPIAAANGQFLLVRRQVYFDVGGHMAVASAVLEDVALAKLIKRRNAIRLRYAPEAVSTRMYRTTGELVEGWTKNLAMLFGNTLFMAATTLLNFVLLIGLPLLIVTMNLTVLQKGLIGLVWLRVIFYYFSRVGRSHAPIVDRILSILGLPFFAFLLVRSWQKVTMLKSVTWKGREYTT
jgi:cellulose synthase/poly-beta-1,6-N-acetylglucosamine synthase-like glycosyltransferase